MHHNTPIIPYVSLCSGYEGIGLGLHNCIPNLRTIAYCEREAFAIANLVAKMENGLLDEAPVFTDVTTFPWEQFAPYMARGILSFGWPCQPVSCAGKRKATEDERWLFDIIADGVSIMRPGILFAENVEGLLSAKMPDGSLVFSHCIERLESLHYKVTAGIFSAREVGAPHQRKRVFILADKQRDGLERPARKSIQGDFCGLAFNGRNVWPSRPGEPQHAWEPPRVVGNAESEQGSSRDHRGESAATSNTQQVESGGGDCGSLRDCDRETQPTLGRDPHWDSDWMDNAELYTTCDNRTDELRLLGNGVVPATAERAFRTLLKELYGN